jgi:hypothetical protein
MYLNVCYRNSIENTAHFFLWLCKKAKVEVAPRYGNIWGSGGIASHINFHTRWRRAVSFTPQPPYPPEKTAVRIG